MSRSRWMKPRTIAARIAPAVLALGAIPLMAPNCGGTGGVQSFSRGSLVIPMDLCYQYQTDGVSNAYPPTSCAQSAADPGNVIRAYGLVYQLVRNNIAVYWIIAPNKPALTSADLTIQYNGGVPALLYDWATGNPGTTAPAGTSHSITYLGGPFVVDGSDFARASQVLQTYKALYGNVNVHVSNVAFQANVAKTMAGGWSAGGSVPPKLALLDIGSSGAGTKNSEVVIQGYLTQAGLDFAGASGTATGTHGQIYDRLLMEDFWPDASGTPQSSNLFKNGYQILWVPHWAAPSSCSDCSGTSCTCANKYGATQIDAALKTMGAFSAAGHDVFAECAGLGSFEGVVSNTTYRVGATDGSTHFETTAAAGAAGLSSINTGVGNPNAAYFVPGNFSSPLLQIGDFPFLPQSGAIQDFKSSLYKAETTHLIEDRDHTWDVFTFVAPSTTTPAHGTIVYLGGHSYSGTDGTFQIAGTRLVLNTLFNLGAACVSSGVACNTGKLGVCAIGTMQCDPNTGLPACVQTFSPSAEICDGKDNDCNGLVDDGLDTGCYDGPSATRNVGICHDGVRSCVKNADGTYGMSACQGQVLPSTEVCNGLDDDCNGYVDDDPAHAPGTQPLEQACYTGPSTSLDPTTGYPRGICKAGIQTCSGGVWGACPVCPANAWVTPGNYPACEILPQTETCGTDGQGNQVDMNCNGIVADGCGCTVGATQPCYRGPNGTLNVGVCRAGTQTCQAGTPSSWGACTGDVLPGPLNCAKPPNAVDDNCNGVPDYQEPGCNLCPPPGDPSLVCYDGAPGTLVVLRARGSATGGSLAAGTYFYEVTALTAGTPSESAPSNEQSVVTTGSTSSVSLTWSAFPNATGYRVYRGTAAGGENVFYARGNVTAFTDTGAGATTGTPPKPGVCRAGTASCSNGVLGACNGQILPSPEVCNGRDDDCNGLVDDGASCGAGLSCVNGTCVPASCGVETLCPEGFTCSSGACVAAPCGTGGICPAGDACRFGQCSDPCTGITCGAGTFCASGTCTAGSCYNAGCPQGQLCRSGACVTDACALLPSPCPAGTFCRAGDCVQACVFQTCPAGQSCGVDGFCANDPCAAVSCAPDRLCENGACVPNLCLGISCGPGLVCQDGACIDDPCAGVVCPAGTCVRGQCYSTGFVTPLPDGKTTSTSCGCGSGAGSATTALLFLAALPLARRRRRAAGSGRALAVLAVAVALGGLACKKTTESFDPSLCPESCGEQRCVDVTTDPTHCGACGKVCSAGQVCAASTCGPGGVAPYVASAAPAQAPKGAVTQVSLTGERFQTGAEVRVIAPAGTTTYAATVTDASHLSATLDFTSFVTTSLSLRVVNADRVISNALPFDVVTPTPVVLDVTPFSVLAGQTQQLAVTGTGFIASSTCHVQGPSGVNQALTTTVTSGTAISCAFATAGLQVGSYQLWVVNEGTLASNPWTPLTITSSGAPTITSLSPSAAAPGASVTLQVNGSGFDATSVVTATPSIAGLTTAAFDPANPTRLVANFTAPACASSPCNYAIAATNSSGTSNSLTFSVLAGALSVTSLSVTPAPPTGLYQDQTATLTFGGTGISAPASTTVQPPAGNPITIPACGTAPCTSVSGSTAAASLNLATACGGPCPAGLYSAALTSNGVTSASFPFRVLSNVAILQSASPAGGAQGTSPSVTLTGSNFRGTSAVIQLLQNTTPIRTISCPGTMPACTWSPPTSAAASIDLAGLDTGVYSLTVTNAGAAASNAVSFSVTPGLPTLTGVAPATVSQTSAAIPTTVNLTGTNFAKPDANGNAASQVMVSADSGTTWGPLPAGNPVTVVSPTSIQIAFDVRTAVPGSYLIQVWNPPGPQRSGSQTFTVTQ